MFNKKEFSRFKNMKVLVFILMFSQFASSQRLVFEKPFNVDYFKMDSIILGDWSLFKVDLYNDYYFFDDTNKSSKLKNGHQKLRFTTDSIFTTPDHMERYYIRHNNYSYKIEYDSIYQANYIKLFQGKKKKQKELTSYEIIKCTIDELIIKSYLYLNQGLDMNPLSIIYSYRKDIDSTLSPELLSGNWYYSSTKYFDLYSSDDSTTFHFSRENIGVNKGNEKSEIKFWQENYGNYCVFWSYHPNLYVGSSEIPYMLDVKNKLIYLGSKIPKVFNIEILNQKELLISLNIEKTEHLKGVLINKKDVNSH